MHQFCSPRPVETYIFVVGNDISELREAPLRYTIDSMKRIFLLTLSLYLCLGGAYSAIAGDSPDFRQGKLIDISSDDRFIDGTEIVTCLEARPDKLHIQW